MILVRKAFNARDASVIVVIRVLSFIIILWLSYVHLRYDHFMEITCVNGLCFVTAMFKPHCDPETFKSTHQNSFNQIQNNMNDINEITLDERIK